MKKCRQHPKYKDIQVMTDRRPLALDARIADLERRLAAQNEELRQYRLHLEGGDAVAKARSDNATLTAERDRLRDRIAELERSMLAIAEDGANGKGADCASVARSALGLGGLYDDEVPTYEELIASRRGADNGSK